MKYVSILSVDPRVVKRMMPADYMVWYGPNLYEPLGVRIYSDGFR